MEALAWILTINGLGQTLKVWSPIKLLVKTKSSADFAQLRFAIGKSFRILIILSLEGKLWAVDLAVSNWPVVWRGSTLLGSAPKTWQRLYRSGLGGLLSIWGYPSKFGCLAERKKRTAVKTLVRASPFCRCDRQRTSSWCHCKGGGQRFDSERDSSERAG